MAMRMILLAILTLSFTVQAAPVPAKLRYSFDFIFEKVLEKKKLKYNPEIPLPSVHYESETPLEVFQDALEEQWGMRPNVFTNAYSIKHNMIFISDDASYYDRLGRCMDDSLAHELVHYLQDRYLKWEFDESLEWEAVEIQTQFREEYCK